MSRVNTWLVCGALSMGAFAGSVTEASMAKAASAALQERLDKSPIAKILEGKTVRMQDGKLVKANPRNTLFYIFFYGAGSSEACRKVVSDMDGDYSNLENSYPLMEVILCSGDEDAQETEKWVKEAEIEWPILMKKQLAEMPAVRKLLSDKMPCFVLVDAAGAKIAEGPISDLHDTFINMLSVLQYDYLDDFVGIDIPESEIEMPKAEIRKLISRMAFYTTQKAKK